MLQQSLDRLVDTAAWWTISVLHALTLSHISTSPPLLTPPKQPQYLALSGGYACVGSAPWSSRPHDLCSSRALTASWTLQPGGHFVYCTLSHLVIFRLPRMGVESTWKKKKWGGEEDQRLTRRQSPSTSPAGPSPWRSPPLSLSGPRKKPKLESGADCQ